MKKKLELAKTEKFESIDDALIYFVGLQKKIHDLKTEIEKLCEGNKEIKSRQDEMNQLFQKYKKETKDYFGATDNENINIVQLAHMMRKVAK